MDDDFDKTVPAGPHQRPRPSRSDPAGSLVGKTIGGYLIKELLGKGGMGEVYLAEQNLGAGTKLVALKTIQAQYLALEDSVPRFQEEAFAAGTLKTGYVAQVMDYGQVAAQPDIPAMHYLVMEYCSGGTLLDYMVSFPDGRLPVDEGIRLLRQAAEGLLAAERRLDGQGRPDPLVHRDIKPANLLLQKLDGTDRVDLRIADFGAVKRKGRQQSTSAGSMDLSRTGPPMTPGYASPEQWEWEETDHRSDIYALGATFYHVLTGQRATPDSTQLSIIRKFVMQTPCLSPKAVLEDVPEPLNRVIEKMTARHPKDRYQSFAEIIGELKVFEQQPASMAKVWATVGLSLAALATIVLWWVQGQNYSSPERLLGDYQALQQRVDAAQGRDWLAALGTIGNQLDGIARRVQAQRQELETEIAAKGSEASVSMDALDTKAKLGGELDRLEAMIAAAQRPTSQLDKLEVDFLSMSAADSRAAALGIQVPEGVPAIRDRQRQMLEKIDELRRKRERVLSAIEADFTNFDEVRIREAAVLADAFRGQQLRVEAFSSNEGSHEPELARRAQDLLDAIGGARALEAGLPSWAANEADPPLAQLQLLIVALTAIHGVPNPDGEVLQTWWRRRLDSLAETWQPQVLALIDRAKRDLENSVDGLQETDVESEREDLLRRRVRPVWQETKDAFAKLSKTMGSGDRAAVFDAQNHLEIRSRADAGPQPTLNFSVAALKRSYVRANEIATTCRTGVAALSPLDVDLPQELKDLENAAKNAIRALDDVDKPQISEFPSHRLPPELIRQLQILMRGYLARIRIRFQDDELSLDQASRTLASFEEAFSGWHEEQRRVSALRKNVDGARTLLELYPFEIPNRETLTKEQVETLRKALSSITSLMEAEGIADEDLENWRVSWRNKKLVELVVPVQQQLPEAREDLRSVVQELEKIASVIQKLDRSLGERFLKDVQRALKAIDMGAAPKKPESWSEAAWRLWPQPVAPPNGLQAEVRDGRLVCWLPFRKRKLPDGSEQPVEMVLVQSGNQRPFLVDRHEVCVGELQALGVSRNVNDPGQYLEWRHVYWPRIRIAPTALLSWTSHEMARGFVTEAYARSGAAFSLPVPQQWQALRPPNATSGRQEQSNPAALRIEDLEEQNGVLGLASGLAEWLQNGTVVGPTDYERASLDGPAAWKKGVGFRCVLTLQ